MVTVGPRDFARIQELAAQTCGIHLPPGKENLVAARLTRLLHKTNCASFDEYYQRLSSDHTGAALIELIDALTTNHTSFFRETAHFEFLRNVFLPHFNPYETISVWSAACSTGEEPYSIAMELVDAIGFESRARIQIVATDISQRVLAAARSGVYPAERLAGIPPERLRAFCLRGVDDRKGYYRFKKEIRDLINFRRVNLMENCEVGIFPLIFCRNVLLYFDRATQQQVIARLTDRLEPGGYLFIGHTENFLGVQHRLEYVKPAIYRKPGPALRSGGRR